MAYIRAAFTDIPFSARIWDILMAQQGPLRPNDKDRVDSWPVIVPYFETRYKMTDVVIKERGITQVLELAAGMSPRGLIWSMNEDNGNYVELDLPGNSALKANVLKQIVDAKATWPSNLILEQGTASDEKDFDRACQHFNCMPVAVTCEGLLRYISWPDKVAIARNVARLLAKNGGIWITPDIELLCDVNASPIMSDRYASWAKERGFDVRPFLFKDLSHAYGFFEELGFKVEMRV